MMQRETMGAIMKLRSWRERVYQTLAYEFFGLVLIAPLVSAMLGLTGGESVWLLVWVALGCMVWSPIHNTVFDWAEWRLARRMASDRPQGWRMVHAISHEATSVVVTTPLIMLISGLSLLDALALDLGLTVAYTAYAYLFHMGYDWLRPVEGDSGSVARTVPGLM
jgi:uncharacterized membrane protein